MTHQSAEAHRFIFQKIDDVVKIDTGSRLKWRHIDSASNAIEDQIGITHFAVDQHGGQAKGTHAINCKIICFIF